MSTNSWTATSPPDDAVASFSSSPQPSAAYPPGAVTPSHFAALAATLPPNFLSVISATVVTLTALGGAGNVMAFVVVMTKELRELALGVYMAFLAIFDLLTLVGGLVWYITLVHMNPSTCAMRSFVAWFPEAVANWIIVVLTLDRMCSIFFPFKMRSWGLSTAQSAVRVCVVVVIITFSFNFPRFWFWRFDPETKKCVINEATAGAATEVYPWIGALVYFVIPVAKLVLANGAVIWQIRSMGKDLQAVKDAALNKDGSFKDPRAEAARRMTVTLIVVSLTYSLLELPNAIVRTLSATKYYPIESLNHPTTFQFLAMICCQLNHSINFFLYIISGKLFRAHAKRIFGCGFFFVDDETMTRTTTISSNAKSSSGGNSKAAGMSLKNPSFEST